MPFRQHKYFSTFYIFLSIIILPFLNFLRGVNKKYFLIIFIFLIFINIAFSVENILKNSDMWCEISIREGIKFSSLFRDKENVADKLLGISNKADIIAVPNEISKIFALYSGLDVVYTPWLHKLYRENIPQLQLDRKKDIETIYNPDTEEIILKKLFEKYRVKYFLVFKEDRKKYDSIKFLEIIDEGKWCVNKELLIYKVIHN